MKRYIVPDTLFSTKFTKYLEQSNDSSEEKKTNPHGFPSWPDPKVWRKYDAQTFLKAKKYWQENGYTYNSQLNEFKKTRR